MLLRQSLYFGLPMAILSVGAVAAWSTPQANYLQHMYRAQALSQQGDSSQAEQEARVAYSDMNRQLPLAKKMAELDPSAPHEAELAFLTYNQSMYRNIVMTQLAGRRVTPDVLAAHCENISHAVLLLESAMRRSGSLAHPGREQFTREDAERVLASWKKLVR